MPPICVGRPPRRIAQGGCDKEMSYTAIVDYGVGNLKSVANAMQFWACGP